MSFFARLLQKAACLSTLNKNWHFPNASYCLSAASIFFLHLIGNVFIDKSIKSALVLPGSLSFGLSPPSIEFRAWYALLTSMRF